MAKKYDIKNVRRRGSKWQIRFYNSSRSPKQTVVTRDFDAFTARQIEQERNRLYYLWEKGDFDPWNESRPGEDHRDYLEVGDAVELHIEEKVAAGKRGERGGWTKATARGKRSPLRVLAATVGKKMGVDQITAEDLRQFVHYGGGRKKKGLAHATRRTYRGCAKSFLRWLIDEEHLPAEEAPELPPPLEKRRRFPPYVTEKEMEAICAQHMKHVEAARARLTKGLTYTSSAWYTDLYRFRFYLGHRPSEAMEQRVGACDLDRWLMQIGDATHVPKNKREGVIPIVPPARKLVEELCTDENGEKRPAGERLFRRKSFKKPSEAFREAALKKVPRKVKQEGLAFYNLRHSCGVYWRRRGLPLSSIQKLLRHSNPEQTQIYAEIEPMDLGRQFERAYSDFEEASQKASESDS